MTLRFECGHFWGGTLHLELVFTLLDQHPEGECLLPLVLSHPRSQVSKRLQSNRAFVQLSHSCLQSHTKFCTSSRPQSLDSLPVRFHESPCIGGRAHSSPAYHFIRPSSFSSFDPWTVNASTIGRTWAATWSNWLFIPRASALCPCIKDGCFPSLLSPGQGWQNSLCASEHRYTIRLNVKMLTVVVEVTCKV